MMLRKLLIFSLPVLIAGALSPVLHGQALTFSLDGSQEVPPVTTDASGNCNGLIAPNSFGIDCQASGLSEVVGAHIYKAPAGQNGGVVFAFSAATTFSAVVNAESLQEQSSSLTWPEFLESLLAGELYVNVHSPANPGGEIRGQIPLQTTFEHFGNGGTGVSIVSDIVFVNSATTGGAVNGTVYFFDQDGNPISPEEVLGGSEGLTGDGGGADGGVPFSIDPLAVVSQR